MRLVLVLVCVILMSAVESISIHYFIHPKSRDPRPEIQEKRTHIILPEERRKLGIFSHLNKKFMVTPAPSRFVTRTTRKPVMKKMVFQNKPIDENIVIEPITERTIFNANRDNEKNVKQVPQDIYHELKDKEFSDVATQTPKENKDTITLIQKAADPITEQNFKVEDSNLKPIDVDIDNFKPVQFDTVHFSDEDNQVADGKEFIFVDPEQIQKKPDVDEVAQEYVTSQPELDMPRVKRSDNIIEEENRATTVAGYKFTWWDKSLTNNLAFKNINS